jgi:FKBP-type peptidyl-prolyl cis-trans isomerase FklB
MTNFSYFINHSKKRLIPAYTLTVMLTGLALPSYAASQDDKDLKLQTKTYSYALALEYMKGLKEDGVPLDAQAFFDGLKDIQADKPLRLNHEQQQNAVNVFVAKRMMQQQANNEARKEAGRDFQLAYGFESGVQQLPSGVQYKVLSPGNGENSPKAGDGVSLQYRISNLQDKEIVHSLNGKKLMLNSMIPGWQEVVTKMKPGSKYQIILPPDSAYGAKGTPDGSVKPYETLKCELELLAIIPEDDARAAMDKPEVSSTQTVK